MRGDSFTKKLSEENSTLILQVIRSYMLKSNRFSLEVEWGNPVTQLPYKHLLVYKMTQYSSYPHISLIDNSNHNEGKKKKPVFV
jgi:hypothetical protein